MPRFPSAQGRLNHEPGFHLSCDEHLSEGWGPPLTTLTVTDNGPGFEPGQREKIFRPFFTTKSGGIGLGLALTQKIIVTHNGRVTASVSASGGARMDVVLPLQRVSHHVQ